MEHTNMGGWITENELCGKLQPCGCSEPYPDNYDRCPLNKPLMICIPPEGIHISCPVHSKGHHIYGQSVRC